MSTFNVREAKTQLSRLLERAAQGEAQAFLDSLKRKPPLRR
jgi:hypothetical protein